MSKIDEGDVVIVLNGVEKTLKPTLRAMNMISAQFGGLTPARQGIVAQNMNVIVGVIRYGLNLTDAQATKLPDEVFRNGINDPLLVPLIDYLGVLGNGGKRSPDDPVMQQGEGDDQGND